MKIASNRIGDIIRFFKQELKELYGEAELNTIISWCFEAFLNLNRTQLMLKSDQTVSESELLKFNFAVKDLKQQKPIQYILGEADFYRRKFIVNGHVLIPRPETEELADLIIRENRGKEHLKILDIGTGSGCIAVTLAKELTGSEVLALDISHDAIDVARRNSEKHNAGINYFTADILDPDFSPPAALDIIVSNPPYITVSEKNAMAKNVLDYEPHLALFVAGKDPLLFYRRIADIAIRALRKNGSLYFEVNSSLGPETQHLLEKKGFKNVKLFKDLSDNNRILRGNI
ncbi:MAG: peptide chain release factor N(5)-glutamine methyltransferase [Bacteroidia bacterium]